MSVYLIDGGSHADRPLSNLAVEAFNTGGDFVGGVLFPTVPVGKQSDTYYVMDKGTFLANHDTLRAPKTAANRGEWKVSSSTYFAKNYAFGTDYALETIANADAAIRVRQTSTRFVTEVLARDKEIRIANTVTSISNVGSGVTLAGTAQWSDPINSEPIGDVNSGHAFIENNTGLTANTIVMDKDTHATLMYHPEIRDYVKYTGAGPVTDAALAQVFRVDRILVARGVYNSAAEGATASISQIWGKNFLLCRIDPMAASLQTKTFGLGMQWTPEGFPAPMAVERHNGGDPSKKIEVLEAQYFADEKIVAPDLAYLIKSPVA